VARQLVYLVTCFVYATIHGVFSSRERADAHVHRLMRADDLSRNLSHQGRAYWVEEVELDSADYYQELD
jgi:hypothetical protein